MPRNLIARRRSPCVRTGSRQAIVASRRTADEQRERIDPTGPYAHGVPALRMFRLSGSAGSAAAGLFRHHSVEAAKNVGSSNGPNSRESACDRRLGG